MLIFLVIFDLVPHLSYPNYPKKLQNCSQVFYLTYPMHSMTNGNKKKLDLTDFYKSMKGLFSFKQGAFFTGPP